MLRPEPSGSLVWPAAVIVWGPGFVSAAHRHQRVQLVLAMEGKLLVRKRPQDEWAKCSGVLVRPGAVHEIDARDGTILIALVDAESELGAALSERLDGDVSCLGARQVASWRAVLGPVPSESRVESWVKQLLPRSRRVSKIHPRVNRVLSASRFMHVFTESVGVPLRPYILWLRLQHAACEMSDEASVTRRVAGDAMK